MRRGRIEAIVPTGQITPDSAMQVFPASGRYVIPGLIDGHVHAQGLINPPWKLENPSLRANLERFLYGGSTTVIDLGGSLSKLEQAKRSIREQSATGPDLHYSGQGITAIDGHPTHLSKFVRWPLSKIVRKYLATEVSNVEDVNNALSKIKRDNGLIAKFIVDDIPVGVPKLNDKLLRQGIVRAKAMQLITVAHIGSNVDAQTAVAAGIQILAHNVYREPIEQRTLDEIRVAGVKVMPTVGVFRRIEDLNAERTVDWTPMTRELSPADILASFYERPDAEKFQKIKPYDTFFANLEANRDIRIENAKKLREAGIAIVVGSDSPAAGWQAGSALIEELQLLVEEVGYTPLEALRAATLDNAKHFDFRDRGQIAEKLRADLVVLNSNPLEDIRALSDISAVFLEGSLVARKPLAR